MFASPSPAHEEAPPAQTVAIQPEPPTQPQKSGGRSRAAGIGAALLALAAKFKTALLFIGKFKILVSALSLVASIWAWSTIFGWAFAAGFVLLILVHEMGHVLSLRSNGISASVPLFVPFVGAFVALRDMPRNAAIEAEVALAGPLLGTAGAAVCYLVGWVTHQALWYALASTGFFINLFNLAPILPLDGGRVVSAISPKLWFVGALVLAAMAVLRPGPWLIYIGIIVVLSLPRFVAAFKGARPDDPYYTVEPRTRLWTAVQYFGLAALLAVMWHAAGAAVQPVTPQ